MEPTPPWWKRTTVYQLYPRSFRDSNGDGIGDLPGVLEKLDYLKDLGVETVWLSPFFQSPQADFGYDVSDYLDVAPEYGTPDDVRALIAGLHQRGMKVMFDLVLNHTSDQHPWFLDSARAKDSPKRDWYLWRDGRADRPPNNWRSMLGPSGWHRHPATGQWYWASFLPFQPDLNWRNPQVQAALLGVVRHWLEAGVDGFRLDVFGALFKDAQFRDNPRSARALPSEDNPEGFFQRPDHTVNLDETFAFGRALRALADAAEPPRVLLGEVFGSPAVLRRCLGEAGDGLNLVFFFKALRTPFTAPAFRALIAEAEAAFGEPLIPTWAFGNHDRPRSIARLGGDDDQARLLAAVQLSVRGVPVIYYGEEIGLPHVDVPSGEAKDPVAKGYRWVPRWVERWLLGRAIVLNRDVCRAPMAWTAGPHAGFSSGAAWLPTTADAPTRNVDAQRRAPLSLLNTYRRWLALRAATPALNAGTLTLLPSPAPDVLAFRRGHPAGDVTVWANFSRRPVALSLTGHPGGSLTSTHAAEPIARPDRHTLQAWEAVAVVDG